MKSLVKNLVLLGVFSIIFSGLMSCGLSSGASTTKSEDEGKKPEIKEDGYPPPPTKIAEAKFKIVGDKEFSLKEAQGKVTLINLWGVWCIPCIKEMPELVKMEEEYGDKGFQIIGLNVGDADGNTETVENIEGFRKKQNLNYKLGWVDRSVLGEFYKLARISAVPQSFLINRSGKLVGVFVGGGPSSLKPMKKEVNKWVNK